MKNWKKEYCNKFGLCLEGGTCQCKAELRFIQTLLTEQLEELERWMERKIAIHKKLGEECIGSLEEIEQGFPRNNPHTFVIEQLEQVLSHIREQMLELLKK